MSKTERLFPLDTLGGRIQNRRINVLKKTRPEFYDLVRPGEKIGNDSKSRTIKNWESGETIPDIDTIKKICNILDCSSDYLLGLNECTSKDIQFIHDKTGLSENSIEILQKFTTYDCGNIRLTIIDYLLQNDYFTEHLLDLINTYYEKYVYFKNGETIYIEEQKQIKEKAKNNLYKFIEYTEEFQTIDRHQVAERSNVKDAFHFKVQKEFDNILENLIKYFYNRNNKAPGTD